jgi:hypothetical protein
LQYGIAWIITIIVVPVFSAEAARAEAAADNTALVGGLKRAEEILP